MDDDEFTAAQKIIDNADSEITFIECGKKKLILFDAYDHMDEFNKK